MVENNGNFGFPHNFSYEEGTYHRRYFYPRVVCCRRRGVMEEDSVSPAQSPIASPQHRPLLAHVQGSAVVSKIARPQNSSSTSTSCTTTSYSSDRQTADPLAPGYKGSTGVGGGGGAGGASRRIGTDTTNAGSAYPYRNSPDPGGNFTSPPSTVGQSAKTGVILDQPLTSASFGFPYLTDLGPSQQQVPCKNHYSDLSVGQGHGTATSAGGAVEEEGGERKVNGHMCDAPPAEDGTLLPPTSPETPSEGDDNQQRPVFRLSEESDYSEDYTDMTGGTLAGDLGGGGGGAPGEVTSPPMNGNDMNGSSVFSDVFSDRSSDTVGTQDLLEDELLPGALMPGYEGCPLVEAKVNDSDGDTPPGNQNYEAGQNGDKEEEEGDDMGINQTLLNKVLKLDITCATEHAQNVLRQDNNGEDNEDGMEMIDVLSPPLSTPEIQVDEIPLQEDNLKDVKVPLDDGDDTNKRESGFYREDREFDFLKAAPKVKRSTSLKTYKTPPGTPKRKMVRFADALGLDLESVRHILNMEAPPKIPQSATQDLDLHGDDDERAFFKMPPTGGARYLTACFPQPGSNPAFPLMVRDRKVIMESSVINDQSLSVTGTIRVANVSFHKKVTVRYTTNNWLTFNDINAGYVHGSNDGPTDRFSFTISLPHYFSTGSRMQFCIQYVCGGEVFWDNNHGNNYIIECFARSLPDSDNTWMSFL